jgi:hypothetical protein
MKVRYFRDHTNGSILLYYVQNVVNDLIVRAVTITHIASPDANTNGQNYERNKIYAPYLFLQNMN